MMRPVNTHCMVAGCLHTFANVLGSGQVKSKESPPADGDVVIVRAFALRSALTLRTDSSSKLFQTLVYMNVSSLGTWLRIRRASRYT